MIFAIPWLGRFLVGTTDDEAQHGDEMVVTKAEAEYLLRHLNRYIVTPMRLDQIVSGFAGVRPLVKSKNSLDTKKLIRDHEVEMEEESGLISVLGGKWTTYRAMAQDGVDMALGYLGKPLIPCRTAQHKLHGAEGYGRRSSGEFWCRSIGVSPATARHLVGEIRHGFAPGDGNCQTRFALRCSNCCRACRQSRRKSFTACGKRWR